MTRILRLLLIAAIALPLWQPAAAQEVVAQQDDGVKKAVISATLPIKQFSKPHDDAMISPSSDVKTTANKPKTTNKRARKAPVATKATGKFKAPAVGRGISLKAPPSGATIEEWQIQTDWYDNAAYTSSSETGWVLGTFGYSTVNVAISGNKVYIQGLSKYVRDGWVEGTISGSTVTFATGQDYGTDEDGKHHYFVGEWEQAVADVIFNYDATNGILTQYYEMGTNDDGSTYPYYRYINESATTTDLATGFGYHEGMILMKISDRPMKTLSEAEIRALENAPDGEDHFHYQYTVSGQTLTGCLMDTVVVKDEPSAEHAIALLRAVYTNKYLPGPKNFRGFTANGVEEGTVSYAGVGKITGNATRNWTREIYNGRYVYTNTLSNVNYSDAYGWDISGNPVSPIWWPAQNENPVDLGGNYDYRYDRSQYTYLDPTQYQPIDEGYTMLLVEMPDNFDASSVWDANNNTYVTFDSDPHKNLVQYVLRTIKSVRIIPEAKRTGTNVAQGTLFKIDANKINRFYLISKGQARYYKQSYAGTYKNFDFCDEPYLGPSYHYLGTQYGTSYYQLDYNNGFYDGDVQPFLYHMFEQFSPAMGREGSALSNIYKTLVSGLETGNAKTGFAVFHDCSTVPFAEADKGKGHEFKMLADGESIDNAPDVRDLLFFVPDHRLAYHENTTFPDGTTHSRDGAVYEGDNTLVQKFIYYNQDRAPRMDMFVIHLNPIIGEQVEVDGVMKHVYQLELNWKSNMNSFLPAEKQEFSLWRVITTADHSTNYERVYRVNQLGQYVDAEGNVLADQNDVTKRVPVTMKGIYGLNELDYFDYIPMDSTGKQVTYVVRGQDAADPVTGKHFLSLQYSNAQSYLIPGYDKNVRMTLKIDSDNYSKFDLPAQKNHYWNEIAVANNKGTSVTANFLKVGTVIEFKRWQNSTATTNPVTVATAKVTSKDDAAGTITVEMNYLNQEDFTGSRNSDEYNKSQFTFTYPAGNTEGEIEFSDFKFYDNFTVDVSENMHPYNYYYRAYFESAVPFDLDPDEQGNVEQSSDVYSNFRGFKVFKTNPSVDGALTIQQVLDDAHMGETVTENYKYKITAEQSQLSELWRYEICRWAVNANVPEEFIYFGDVQNQGDYGYSSTFGRNTYMYQDNFDASEGLVTDIELEDRELKENGGAYYYVPQAVVFTKRTDNNTYGAPRVSNAIGKLKVEIVAPDTEHPLMTTARFRKDGAWYAYYNIYLKFKTLNIPDGYELYKVRAWRKIDPSVLGEEWQSRQVRITDIDENGWYLYEDINYGDLFNVADDDFTMCKENFVSNAYMIGERSTEIAKPKNPDGTGGEPLFGDDMVKDDNGNNVKVVHGDLRASFGAKRLPTRENDPDAAIQELTADFKVRAYFTRQQGNPLVGGAATSNAPRLKDETMPGSGFDYFIAEGTAKFNSSNYTIITGIENLHAGEVVGVKYYNVAGIESDRPFKGVNIVVTRYSDGSTTTTKILK